MKTKIKKKNMKKYEKLKFYNSEILKYKDILKIKFTL